MPHLISKKRYDSVLAQTLTNFEIIVINDASTDDTAARVSRYTDPRIRLRHNRVNCGLCDSRNTGMAAACAPWIALLDADDCSSPTAWKRYIVWRAARMRILS